MNDLIVNAFAITVKPYTSDYRSIDEHVRLTTWNEAWGRKWKVPQDHKDTMLELNNAVVLCVTTNNDDGFLRVHAPSVSEAMEILKRRYPKIHAQIPSFDPDKFEGIAAKCKGSSNLSYHAIPADMDAEDIQLCYMGGEMEPDDYVGDYPDTGAFISAVREKQTLLWIQCYPRTPVGFWSYYGFDFNELMNHVIKE